jgi:hypothetical protein
MATLKEEEEERGLRIEFTKKKNERKLSCGV